MRREEFLNQFGTFEPEEAISGSSGGKAWRGRHLPSDAPAILEILPLQSQDLQAPHGQGFWDDWKEKTRGAPEWVQILEHGLAEIQTQGRIEQRTYLIRRWAQGENLATLIRSKGFIPLESKLRVIARAASALDRLHKAGLVHGGLCPYSIRIDEGQGVQLEPPELVPDDDARQRRYAAPERDRFGGSPSGDLFSLALILFEWITFRHPFEAPLIEDVVRSIRERSETLSKALPWTISRLNAVLKQALSKLPQERFARGRDLAEALEKVMPKLAAAGRRLSPRLSELRRRFESLVADGVGEWHVEGFFDSRLTLIEPPEGDPEDYGNRLLLLRAYQEGMDRWIRCRDQARTIHERLAQARQALEDGEYPRCFSNLDAVFRIHPDNRSAGGLRDRCIVKARAEDERRLCLTTALALARKSFASRNYQRCLQILDHARDFDVPDSEAAPLREKALAGLETVLARYAERACKALEQDQIGNAAELCRAGLQVDPKHSGLTGLQEEIEAALERRRQEVKALVRQCRELITDDSCSEALQTAEAALALDPDDQDALKAWREAGDALQRFRRLESLGQLMATFSDLGDDQRAVEIGQRLLEIAPEDAAAAARLKQAEASLRGDALGDDMSVKGLIDSARQALEHQRRSSGRRLLRFALKLVPHHPQAEELRSRLQGHDESPQTPQQPVEPVTPEVSPQARRRRLWPWVSVPAAVTLLLLLAIPSSTVEVPPLLPVSGKLRLAPVPWARLEALYRVEGQERTPVSGVACHGEDPRQQVTPCLLKVPEGRYRIVLSHPQFGRDEFEVLVKAGAMQQSNRWMPKFDADREVDLEMASLMPPEEGGSHE